MTIDKLDSTTPDLTQQNIARLAELFPDCVTEGPRDTASDTGGRVIDLDLLRQALSDHLVEGPQERYRLDWPGKRQALLAANRPIDKTLRPMRGDSVDFDTTRNLFIEGDNLDALKLLQETYLGKVKMIYIDPPYNTGTDFIYKDDFTRSRAEYEAESGQRDEEGGRLVANPETNGRFHSDWLSMMYPRLKLARNLLREDGFIAISIDHNELANLQALCSEVFGEQNFRNQIVVRRGIKNVQSQFQDIAGLTSGHEYILLYSRSSAVRLPKLSFDVEMSAGKWDTFWRGTDRPTMRYALFGQKPETGQWRWSKETAATAKANYEAYLASGSGLSLDDYYFEELQSTRRKLSFVRKNEDGVVQYYVPPRDYKLVSTNWMDITIKGNEIGFDTEKHIDLMTRLCDWLVADGGIVLDFFAGSGTTAHGLINSFVRRQRPVNFILVQLPQPIDHAEFETLADMSRERLRRSLGAIARRHPELAGSLDIGFRALRIDSGNLRDAKVAPAAATQAMLSGMVSHIKDDRGDEDLLFGALLRWGVDITLPIAKRKILGRTVWLVDPPADGDEGAALVACFARPSHGGGGIDVELADALAAMQPLRVLFRDDGFAGDAAKENVASRIKQRSPDTSVRVL
jgi:adenine-specific DNA-methyltransferase